jgi:hypothetical protein
MKMAGYSNNGITRLAHASPEVPSVIMFGRTDASREYRTGDVAELVN